MKKVTYNQSFSIDATTPPKRKDDAYIKLSNSVEIRGNREGLLTLAQKLIEVAEQERETFVKEADTLQAEDLKVFLEDVELKINLNKKIQLN